MNQPNSGAKTSADAENAGTRRGTWRLMPVGFRHASLLVSLLLLIFLSILLGGERRFFGVSVRDLCSCVILLVAVFSVGRRRRTRNVAVGLAVPMLVLTALASLVADPRVEIAENISVLLFFFFTAYVVLGDVLGPGRVTADKIVGAVCVYFFIGIIWARLYALTELLAPASFDFARLDGETVVGRPDVTGFSGLIYYSFVTLSTLGYGDIVPVGPMARTLSWLEALTGQLYIAILVARLVALHITQTYGTRTTGHADDDGKSGGSSP